MNKQLLVPRSWAGSPSPRPALAQGVGADTDRRTVTRIPPQAGHREKRRLALDMLDTLAGWGMKPPVVVADAAHGTNAHLRAGLTDRGIHYMPAVRADVTAHPFDAQPTAPDRTGPVGCRPQPRHRRPAPSRPISARSPPVATPNSPPTSGTYWNGSPPSTARC